MLENSGLAAHVIHSKHGLADGHRRLDAYNHVGGRGLFLVQLANEPSGHSKQNARLENRYLQLLQDVHAGMEILTYYGPSYPRTYAVNEYIHHAINK
jgi:hypothetical protein